MPDDGSLGGYNYNQEQPIDRILEDMEDKPLLNEEQIDQGAGTTLHHGHLTPAELLVVQGLSHGLDLHMIADTTRKGYQTILTQAKSARAALNAKTNAHLVAIALRQGLIQ